MMRTLLFLLILLAKSGLSQSTLGMSGILNNFPDTVTFNDISTFTGWVKNHGPSTYTGQIDVFIGVRDSSGVNITSQSSVQANMLIVSDSIQVQLTDTFTSSKYRAGTNVVVIWPMPAGGTTAPFDTLERTLYVLSPNSLMESNIQKLSILYNSPDQITIFPGFPLRSVTIYDMCGRIALRSSIPAIMLDRLSKGIYVIEAEGINGKRQIGKFLKL